MDINTNNKSNKKIDKKDYTKEVFNLDNFLTSVKKYNSKKIFPSHFPPLKKTLNLLAT